MSREAARPNGTLDRDAPGLDLARSQGQGQDRSHDHGVGQGRDRDHDVRVRQNVVRRLQSAGETGLKAENLKAGLRLRLLPHQHPRHLIQDHGLEIKIVFEPEHEYGPEPELDLEVEVEVTALHGVTVDEKVAINHYRQREHKLTISKAIPI